MINDIKKIFTNENNYISFRDSQNTTLINKNNSFGTPTGIYTYPCKMFKDEVSKCETMEDFIKIFPYIGRHAPKYLYVYTLNPKVPHLDSNSTYNDILPYYKRLLTYKASNKRILEYLKKYIDKEKEEDDFFGMKNYDLFRSHDIRDDKSENEMTKFWTLTYHLMDDDTAKWNNIIRGCGLFYLLDHGTGFIHKNEPIQAVILNIKAVIETKIIDLLDYSKLKNVIREQLKKGEYSSELYNIYDNDPAFFWKCVIFLLNKDPKNIFSFEKHFTSNSKDLKIMNILHGIVPKIDTNFCTKLTHTPEFIKLFMKIGDPFFLKYLEEGQLSLLVKQDSCKVKILDDGEIEGLSRKVILASLLNIDRGTTLTFFKNNKKMSELYDKEIDFFEENEDQVKKLRNFDLAFGFGEDPWARLFGDEEKEYSLTERRYELFKDSYEKATQTSWSYEKFKERSQYWEFYGDYNGYVSLRQQRNGLYKFTSVAGNLKSISTALEEIKKKDIPVWGAVSPKIAAVMVKRYNYSKPNMFVLKLLYKIFKKSSGDIDTELNSDGTITVHYDDVGSVTKVIIMNKGAMPILKELMRSKMKV